MSIVTEELFEVCSIVSSLSASDLLCIRGSIVNYSFVTTTSVNFIHKSCPAKIIFKKVKTKRSNILDSTIVQSTRCRPIAIYT